MRVSHSNKVIRGRYAEHQALCLGSVPLAATLLYKSYMLFPNSLLPSQKLCGNAHGSLTSTVLTLLSRGIDAVLSCLSQKWSFIIIIIIYLYMLKLLSVSNIEYRLKFLSILFICAVSEQNCSIFCKLKDASYRTWAVFLAFFFLHHSHDRYVSLTCKAGKRISNVCCGIAEA